MSIHLLVVAKHEHPDSEIELAAKHAKQTATFRVRCCETPDDLVPIVRSVALERKQRIDVLDLFDHAEPGIQRMGDGVLFNYRGRGLLTARALRPLLTTNARVRLLGCHVALGPEGQKLLPLLRGELGEAITVYGAIRRLDADAEDPKMKGDFYKRGFKRELEEECLFSSTEAMTREAPDQRTRLEEINSWLASVTPRVVRTECRS